MGEAKYGTRKLGQSLEHLESRLLMTADRVMDTHMLGSTLVIDGTDSADKITVDADGKGGVYVYGVPRIKNEVPHFSNVTAIDIKLKGGDDQVTIGGQNAVYMPLSSLKIDLGAGAGVFQRVDGGNLSITGNLSINGSGTQSNLIVDLRRTWNHVGGEAVIKGGASRDSIGLLGHYSSLNVKLGAGNDTLNLGSNSQGSFGNFGSHKVVADLGAGDDTLTLFSSTVDSIYADLGSGKDTLRLYNVQFGLSAEQNKIDGGSDTDTLIATGIVRGKRMLKSF